MKREIHVSKQGSDTNDGSFEHPFLTISKAAKTAEETDTVIVHEGTYRERVAPSNSGRSNLHRIVYTAAEGEKVIIKGSEIISEWTHVKDNIYLAKVDNSMFGDYNPYATTISGDWCIYPIDPMIHTGQVYLDGRAMYEKASVADLNEEMTWCCTVGDTTAEIYANFGCSPTGRLVEINVRSGCFYPDITGINYITVKGFEMAHAATEWAPPTARQPGMLWTRWSKGWIIENNILHDSRCSAISLGKEISTGHNLSTRYRRKPGYRTQLETVFMARHEGWDKERIGSHIVRNNIIYDCGQNGIVGNLGGAFSEIYGNEIYNIGIRHDFVGYEIAAIKLHAAIDTCIHHNLLYNSVRGLWLDWQAQGVRVSSNAFFDNELDFWVEVTHGPHLIDNNLFASKDSLLNHAQGGAYVHNIFCGKISTAPVPYRATPYHLPHSTEIIGTSRIYGNDDRFYRNIFCTTGTDYYNGCPSDFESFQQKVIKNIAETTNMDIESYCFEKLPCYITDNCYFGEAKAYSDEDGALEASLPLTVKVVREADGVYALVNCPIDPHFSSSQTIGTHNLPITYMTEQLYEAPDGTAIEIDTDCSDIKRSTNPTYGAFEQLTKGDNKIRIW